MLSYIQIFLSYRILIGFELKKYIKQFLFRIKAYLIIINISSFSYLVFGIIVNIIIIYNIISFCLTLLDLNPIF